MRENMDVFVYIMAQKKGSNWVAPCKVGVANFPTIRLEQIQTASPFKVGVFKTYRFPCRAIALEMEACFHSLQKEHCLYGEWFDLDPERAASLFYLYTAFTVDFKLSCSPEEKKLYLQMVAGEIA